MPVATSGLAEYSRRVVVTIALIVLALFLWKIAPVLMLAFAGIVFAGAVRAGSEPLTRRLGIRDTWAVAIVFALFLLIIIVGGYVFGKQIAAQTTDLWEAIKAAGAKAQEQVADFPLGAWVLEHMRGASDPEAMGKVFKGTVTVFGSLADVVLVLFLSLYFAVDPKLYRNGVLLMLPESVRDRVGSALDASGDALRKWLVGQLGAMVVVGLLTALGLWLVGVPMAIPLGILSAILDFVPMIGPLIAAIPGILIAFSLGGDVAIYAALVYLGVQFVEGHLVMPLAQKWAVSLPPVLGLLSIVAFGLVFGFIGVLFAMPLTVVAVVLVKRLWVDNPKAPT